MSAIEYVCPCCHLDTRNFESFDHLFDYKDDRTHDVEKAKDLSCPSCGADMDMVIDEHSVRRLDAVFDYHYQVFRTTKGVPLEENDSWDHACPSCNGPSSITSCSAYGENHSCLNCSKTFTVK